MPKSTNEYGVLVAVDGSPESDVAVRWATYEAEMRDASITLVHVVVPVVVSWPVGSLTAEFNQWQEDNARRVLEHVKRFLGCLTFTPRCCMAMPSQRWSTPRSRRRRSSSVAAAWERSAEPSFVR